MIPNLKQSLKRAFKNVKLIESIEFSQSAQTNIMIINHTGYYRNIFIEMCNRYVGRIKLLTFLHLLDPFHLRQEKFNHCVGKLRKWSK